MGAGPSSGRRGLEPCADHGYVLLTCSLRLAQGLVGAGRGQDQAALTIADEMTRWAVPRGVMGVQNFSWHTRAFAAFSRGDYDEAFRQAEYISPGGAFAPHAGHALWVCMDLVEAAVRAHLAEEAVAHVAAIHGAGIHGLSSRAALLVAGSAAMASRADDVGLFQKALASPEAHRWPFDLARVQLAFGERLGEHASPVSTTCEHTDGDGGRFRDQRFQRVMSTESRR